MVFDSVLVGMRLGRFVACATYCNIKARRLLVTATPLRAGSPRPLSHLMPHSCGCLSQLQLQLQFLCFAFRILMFGIAINCGQPMQPMRRNSLIITTTITAMQYSIVSPLPLPLLLQLLGSICYLLIYGQLSLCVFVFICLLVFGFGWPSHLISRRSVLFVIQYAKRPPKN